MESQAANCVARLLCTLKLSSTTAGFSNPESTNCTSQRLNNSSASHHEKRMRREVQDHAAAAEQADDDGVSEGAALPQDETRNAIHVFDLLFSLRRNLVEEVEIDAVDDRQQHGVEQRQRALPPDDEEV